ncbi:MAG: tRNA epoxyqueuosine(34) reductase QueG [Rhodothermales bacterium]
MPGFDTASRRRLTDALKTEARRLGFDACGVSLAERLDDEALRLEQWLTEGRHGTMGWMANHFDKRVDPRRLVDGAQTVISVLHNYYQPAEHPPDPDIGRISRYAWGDDYHEVLKEKLLELYAWLDDEAGGISGRAFVDSAPVMDKAWARRAGLGWMGKHTNLISRTLGSYFFIGELIVDVPLEPDGPIPDHCGSCTRCIDACPTDAIYQPYAVDANRCIAYLTIEHREDDIPPALQQQLGNWIFGCDICQDVCPWNKFRKPTREPRYAPREGIVDTELQEWIELDIEAFRQRFRKNPVKRTKFEGFIRNVRMALTPGRADDAADM